MSQVSSEFCQFLIDFSDWMKGTRNLVHSGANEPYYKKNFVMTQAFITSIDPASPEFPQITCPHHIIHSQLISLNAQWIFTNKEMPKSIYLDYYKWLLVKQEKSVWATHFLMQSIIPLFRFNIFFFKIKLYIIL